MLKTFLLIAHLNGQAYVLDSGLSAGDCMDQIIAGIPSIQISETESVPSAGAILACEAEEAI